jgi:type I restriction enzyme S subunit
VPIFGSNGLLGFHDTSVAAGPGVITGRSGTIGKLFYTEKKYWPLNTSLYVKNFKGNLPKFVYYKLSGVGLEKFSTGTGVPTLNRNVAHKEVVTFPPLAEQKKIVAILSSVDDKLDVIAAQIAATQKLKLGLMQTLFSRGMGNRDSDGRWLPHSKFNEKSSQPVPAGRNNVRLGDIAPLIRRPVEIKPGASYPELGLRSYGKGTFHKPPLSGAEVGSKRLFEIKAGDLLFSNVFAWEGAVAVAKPEDDGRFGSHRYITCEVDATQADIRYLFRYLTTPAGIAALTLASPGGAGRNKTLGLTALANISIPLPPLAEQKEITKILDGVDAKLGVLALKQSSFQTLKRGLMQKLLTGEWRVRVETAVPAGEAAVTA